MGFTRGGQNVKFKVGDVVRVNGKYGRIAVRRMIELYNGRVSTICYVGHDADFGSFYKIALDSQYVWGEEELDFAAVEME